MPCDVKGVWPFRRTVCSPPPVQWSILSLMYAMEPTYAWWACLTAVAAAHAVISIRFARRERGKVPGWALFCYVAFSCGAFLRSAFPVRWSTRPHACLFDVAYRFVGSDIFDRFVAQTAEVSLGTIVALTSGTHLDTLGLPWMAKVARLCAWPIVLAQMCCWVGEITDNKLWHVFEESLWGGTFAVHSALAALAVVLTHSASPPSATKASGASEHSASARPRSLMLALALFSVPYVYFMFTVDVPMYYSQWQADEAKHTQYDSFGPGLLRMLTCQDVADDWAGWQEDATWMFLYFSVGPFAARALASSLGSNPAGSA